MRRPHRSIETFDISLMAVVTKAMGAFLVLMLLLLPYYTPNKLTEEDVQDILEQLKQARESIEQVSRQLGPEKGGDAAKQSLKEATTQLEFTAEVVRKLRALLDKSLAEVARLEAENARLADENNRLSQENQKLKTDLQKADQEIANLKDEIERLRNKLETGDRVIVASLFSPNCRGVHLDGLIMRVGGENNYTWTKDKTPIKPEHLLYINLSSGGEITRFPQKTAAKFVNQGPFTGFSYLPNNVITRFTTGRTGNFVMGVLVKETKRRYTFRDSKYRPLTATPKPCKLEFTASAQVAGSWTGMRARSAQMKAGVTGCGAFRLHQRQKGHNFPPVEQGGTGLVLRVGRKVV